MDNWTCKTVTVLEQVLKMRGNALDYGEWQILHETAIGFCQLHAKFLKFRLWKAGQDPVDYTQIYVGLQLPGSFDRTQDREFTPASPLLETIKIAIIKGVEPIQSTSWRISGVSGSSNILLI